MFTKNDTDLCPFLRTQCVKDRCHLWQPELVNPNPRENPNLVEERYDCEVHWMVVHLRQLSYQQNCTSAVMESFRNESVNNAKMVSIAMAGAVQGVLQDRLKLQEKE